MKKYIIIFYIAIGGFQLIAQPVPLFAPFKGFHFGITGQPELVQKCNFIPLIGDYKYPPIPLYGVGFEVGFECSYHFAKYFGVSVGFNLGTTASWNYKTHMTGGLLFYYGFDVDISKAMYDRFGAHPKSRELDLLFPIKFEFHFPLCKNVFFTSNIGIKLKGLTTLHYSPDAFGVWADEVDVQTEPATADGVIYFQKYFELAGTKLLREFNVDLVFEVGLYYQMPHGDLIRFTVGANLAFRDFLTGYYAYYFDNSYGTFSVRHNFLYAQLAYIHTFSYEKAHHWVRKNGLNFASKKEKQKYIFDVLKHGSGY